MATVDLVPQADNEGSLGTSSKRWGNIWAALINGSFPVTVEVKQLSSDVNLSSTSLTDVAGLNDFTIKAGGRYYFRFRCLVTTNATTVGIKLTVNCSQTPQSVNFIIRYPITTNDVCEAVTALDGGTVPSSGSTVERETIIEGTIQGHATLDSTLTLRQASETATQTTVKSGSIGIVERYA